MAQVSAPSSSSLSSDGNFVGTPSSTSSGDPVKSEPILAWPAVIHTLNGVATVTSAADGEVECIGHIIAAGSSEVPITLSPRDWHTHIGSAALNAHQKHCANVAVAVAFLSLASRGNIALSASDLNFIWFLILEAITSPSLSFTITRSSQGFLSLPLSSIIVDGKIKELWRLHVWEANGARGDADRSIHTHQPFVQSWILAGEGRNRIYEAHPADMTTATHSEYGLLWSDGSEDSSAKSYKVHPKSSTIVNKGNLVRVSETRSTVHTKGMTYSIPANTFHSTEVAIDSLHATLVFFDGVREFYEDAPVLGPIHGTTYVASRDPHNITSTLLGSMVESVRVWETLLDEGMEHTMKTDFEESIRAYQKALHICENDPTFPDALHYKHAVLAKLGWIYRMLGRNELAASVLEAARSEMQPSELLAQLVGELAVVYRHMNRFDDAKQACEDQYAIAQQLGLEREICRAMGTLGMLNYQLSLEKDISLIEPAIAQLTERIQSARRLKAFALEQLSDPKARAEQIEWASHREAIGLGRLSMCFQRTGDLDRAIATALEAVNVVSTTRDSGLLAFERGRYGLALISRGRTEEALAQFNIQNVCTPIIYLCREPSEEHRGYIRDMIEAGADLEIRDELGYSALDCAVYSGDTKTQEIVMEGLWAKFRRGLRSELRATEELQRHLYEAVLRKGYRDIFQDKLRPVLLQSAKRPNLQQLRRAYANALDQDKEKANLFDPLKYVRYTDFLKCGRIPRSDDGYTQHIDLLARGDHSDLFLVFVSYRWMSKNRTASAMNASSEHTAASPGKASPDDLQGTQYHRIKRALQEFLHQNPKIEIKNLGIWIDFACIDQADYDHQKPGMAALLMNLTQCNAMISLVDENYYERSWCCVEVLMYRSLRDSYGGHLWYEHVDGQPNTGESLRLGSLQSGMDRDLSVSHKQVTYESDRPTLMFLERQAKLIS